MTVDATKTATSIIEDQKHMCDPFAADVCKLVKLLSGKKPIVPTEITLHTELCDTSNPYIAISHVWGTPGEDSDYMQPFQKRSRHPFAVPLSIIGENVHNTLPAISAELKSLVKLKFVQQLLQAAGGGSIWFDMKDIDQHNETQKHQQVFHLPKIYQSARAVLIIHTCQYTFEQLTGTAKRLDPISSFPSKSRYYKRLWTYQEELLAREKMHVLISDKAEIAFLSRNYQTDNIHRTFDPAEAAFLFDQRSNGTQPLDDLLMAQLVERKCSVAKDLYFGIAPYIDVPELGQYVDPPSVVLARWQCFLMSKGLLETPMAGFSSRFDGKSTERASWSATGPMVGTRNGLLVEAMTKGYERHKDNMVKWKYRGIKKLTPTENGRESAIIGGLTNPVPLAGDEPDPTPADVTVVIRVDWCEIVYGDLSKHQWNWGGLPPNRARAMIFDSTCDIFFPGDVCDVTTLQVRVRAQLDDSDPGHLRGLLAILLMTRPGMELPSPLAAFDVPCGSIGLGAFSQQIEVA
ncbi:hypothetical protein HDV00_008731 [Rhizophlyctis rosea]|nr:hypothetical protein HDV00_008731 [Rhizophlyctis rosea]